jgi:hypothetical protein
LVGIVFAVDKIAIAYVMQLRRIRDFGVTMEKWEQLFRRTCDKKIRLLTNQIESGLEEEYQDSSKLKEQIEQKWKRREADVQTIHTKTLNDAKVTERRTKRGTTFARQAFFTPEKRPQRNRRISTKN